MRESDVGVASFADQQTRAMTSDSARSRITVHGCSRGVVAGREADQGEIARESVTISEGVTKIEFAVFLNAENFELDFEAFQ